MNRRYIYILAVILICTILVIALIKFPFWNDEEDEYYTMREAGYDSEQKDRFYDDESNKPKPKKYRIKDKVLYIKNVTLPDWELSKKDEYMLNFSKNKTTEFLGVGFKSMKGRMLLFKKDVDISFKVGKKTKFTIKTEEYPNICRPNYDLWSTLGPTFMSFILTEYSTDMIKGHFDPLSIEVTKSYNNRTGQVNTTLTFGKQYDFFPCTAEWDQLEIGHPFLSIDQSAIYDGSGKFLAKFKNNTLNRSIQKNDKLVIRGKVENKIETPYISLSARLQNIPKIERPRSLTVYYISFEE